MGSIALLAVMLGVAPVAPSPLSLPGAGGRVGFDDLRFSVELRKVLVPAGRTGRVDLVDPQSQRVEEIPGFSVSAPGGGGHGQSTTSADSGDGFLFASDRTTRELVIADPSTRGIVARAKLGGAPDYVRWVGTTHEVWVTEPGKKVIETFRVERSTPPRLVRTGAIDVPDGPESLEVDPDRRRIYTNTWKDQTMAVDVAERRIVAEWKNGCGGSRGIALDAQRGLVFVGCDEGRVVALDAIHDGNVVGQARSGGGVDGIGYGPRLSHLYVPGGDSADLTVIGVGPGGTMQVLGKLPTARDAHCVTTDDLGTVYVCDPGHGQLLMFRDPFPPSGPPSSPRTAR